MTFDSIGTAVSAGTGDVIGAISGVVGAGKELAYPVCGEMGDTLNPNYTPEAQNKTESKESYVKEYFFYTDAKNWEDANNFCKATHGDTA
jgi:hypothetical protein